MIKRLLIILSVIVLSACQSKADKLVFFNEGHAFLENGKLCLGNKDKNNVLTYYSIERFGEGFDSRNDGILLSSGPVPVALTYPDTCFSIDLVAGDNVHYHISYIINGMKLRYQFSYQSSGGIVKYKMP